ncbi:uncharacterized protein [Salminus brasiliensis]|uniref:uncharacterized protein isoform X2 n=1 Tax=Salminus brasiliensis TaxID=930266 RepID=UPI003B837F0C
MNGPGFLDLVLTMLLILSLVLLSSSSGFTQSDEPAVDLECLNDYETEVVCHLNSQNLESCSEHRLNVSLPINGSLFACSFQVVSPGICECKFQVEGFVCTETFLTVLQRGETNLITKEIDTCDSIKPKKPVNVSVEMTKNGDFLITWRTNYTSPSSKTFVENLSTELIYALKGSTSNVSRSLEKGRTEYELVGKNLQPNSQYVVVLRVSSDYNNNQIFSDYSEPFEFSTPSSLQNILNIIIPISCIILILFISTIFYCYIKIIRQWWNKIPTPKIAPSFEKPVLRWATFPNEFSPVYLETSKLDPFKEKTWLSPSLDDGSCENSHHSIGKNGDSSHVIYAQTGSEEVEEGVNGSGVQCELLEDYQSTVRTSGSSKVDHNQQVNSGNSSSFSNRCYLGSDSSGSSFLNRSITHTAYPCDETENPFSSMSENLDPVIPTDFEYGPCNDCSGPLDDFRLTQNMPPGSETVVVLGYQSVNDLQNNENIPEAAADESVNQAFISYHNDVNLKVKPVCFKNHPQDLPFPDCESNIILPVDEGYQSFPGLGQNRWSSDHSSGLEQNISPAEAQKELHNMSCSGQQVHAPPFKGLCGPALHVSPGIQIDCSYQRV